MHWRGPLSPSSCWPRRGLSYAPGAAAYETPTDLGPWAALIHFAQRLALSNNYVPSLHVCFAVICIGAYRKRTVRLVKRRSACGRGRGRVDVVNSSALSDRRARGHCLGNRRIALRLRASTAGRELNRVVECGGPARPAIQRRRLDVAERLAVRQALTFEDPRGRFGVWIEQRDGHRRELT